MDTTATLCELCGARLFVSEHILCAPCAQRRQLKVASDRTDTEIRWARLRKAQRRLEAWKAEG